MLNTRLTVLTLSIGLLLSACATTPPTNFYVLEALSQPLASPTVTPTQRTIGIGPLTLPTLLSRKQIVLRTAHNGVQIAEFHQWAAPLKDNLVQVLTQNLARLQPTNIIRAYPWSAFGNVNQHIIIDITRFDAQTGKSVNLEATWAIMEDTSHTLIRNGYSKLEQPLADDLSYAATVDALSQITANFSNELSLALSAAKP